MTMQQYPRQSSARSERPIRQGRVVARTLRWWGSAPALMLAFAAGSVAWAWPADDHHGHGQAVAQGAKLKAAPAASAAFAADAGAVEARYRVSWQPGGSAKPVRADLWRLTRSGDHIVWQRGEVDDHWWRDARGQVHLQRVFHADQRMVSYGAGDLHALGVDTDWDQLGHVVAAPPAAPDAVQWLAQAQLPREYTVQTGAGTLRYVLEQHTLLPAGTAVPAVPAHYASTDAADFGDMEDDPFVRKAMALDVRLGWQRSHSH